LDFLDVGWGGDIKKLRETLPNTFFNIRLSPVEIINQSNEEISETIIRLVRDSKNPYLTGICCINMDDQVSDDKITTIFRTVQELRKALVPQSQRIIEVGPKHKFSRSQLSERTEKRVNVKWDSDDGSRIH
jgi:hypothetical protein